MNKKTKPQIRAAMTAAGLLSNHFVLLDRKVADLGGEPEDLYPLGKQDDPEITPLLGAVAEKLVARGRALRAASAQRSSSVPPQMMFKSVLAPKYLFIINKGGADAPTLLSAMNGTYFVSLYATRMMNQAEHFIVGPPETALIGVYSCDQLGITGWAETDFFGPKGWGHVKQFGLAQCLRDDGPYVRIAHPDQEFGEWFRVGHDPIPFDGYSRVWYVGHVDGRGRYLGGWPLRSGHRLPADYLVALRLA